MKILKKELLKDASGFIVVCPEEPEDLWHLYHIIAKGDRVRTVTIRKIQKESNTGSSSSERMRLNITVAVDTVDFDPVGNVLRLSGRNVTESEYIKLGQYHTLELEVNRNVTISKGRWDTIFLQRLEEASDITKKADVAAVVFQEGLAHICLITPHMTIVQQKVEINIPRKRGGSSNHEKAIQRFFEAILQGIMRHIDFDIVKCLILASPGFLKDQLLEYMIEEATKKDYKVILSNRAKFLPCHASSGFKHALKEVLADPNILRKLEDTKATGEVQVLNEFFDMLNNNPERAYYGPKHVFKANASNAIQVLLVTDELFRSANVKERKKYVQLVESVRENAGEVKIFSGLHVSGEQLSKLSGVAAILRFPMPDIESDNEDEEEDAAEHSDEDYGEGTSAQAVTDLSTALEDAEFDDNGDGV